MRAKKTRVDYLVCRVSPDTVPHLIEVLGIYSSKAKAQKRREELFNTGFRQPTEIRGFFVDVV